MPDASRPSRMIHRSITTSERLSRVSDSAKWLFALLIANQDDEGRYPWTPTMIRSLIVGTQWTTEQADEYCKELIRTKSVSSTYSIRTQNVPSITTPENDPKVPRYAMLTIWRGVELNGTPKSGTPQWTKPRRYAVDENTYPVRTEYVPSTDSLSVLNTDVKIPLDKISGVGAVAPQHTPKTKVLAPPETKRREHEPINDEFLAEVRARFPMLDIDAELARAQNRRQWDDYKDKRRHFEDWLERSRDRLVPSVAAARNGSQPASAVPMPTIWMPSMGTEHRGEGSSIKACSRAECQDRVCLALRRKVRVAGESGKPALGHERAVAPS